MAARNVASNWPPPLLAAKGRERHTAGSTSADFGLLPSSLREAHKVNATRIRSDRLDLSCNSSEMASSRTMAKSSCPSRMLATSSLLRCEESRSAASPRTLRIPATQGTTSHSRMLAPAPRLKFLRCPNCTFWNSLKSSNCARVNTLSRLPASESASVFPLRTVSSVPKYCSNSPICLLMRA